MDITTLAQGGAAGAFIALALYLVKVVVNDNKHSLEAIERGTEESVRLLREISDLLKQPARTARIEERTER